MGRDALKETLRAQFLDPRWGLKIFSGSRRGLGSRASSDTLTSFFLHILDKAGLLDIGLVKETPTCSNRCVGDDRISKCLDKFLLT